MPGMDTGGAPIFAKNFAFAPQCLGFEAEFKSGDAMTENRVASGKKNTRGSGQASAELAPVFLYSGYRTSSTWLWDKFRRDVRACAYYEPFNPILQEMKAESIWSIRPDTWRSRHPDSAAYMAEYAPLLGTVPGVATFPKGDQDGERYVSEAGIDGPLDPDIQAYVSNLITNSQTLGRVPVLSCTRMLGRAAGLSSAFNGCHILLIRNLFQQWCSYSGQLRFGNDYFFRTLYSSLKLQERVEYIAFLRGFLSESQLTDFERWVDPGHHDLIFCYFCAFHIFFLMVCRRKCDIVIDVNQLARLGSGYQKEIADQVISKTGLQIDLSDARERVDYPAHLLKSSEDCRFLLRAMIDQLLASEARSAEDRSFAEALLTDLWDEYARFTAVTSGAAEVIEGAAAKAVQQAHQYSEAQALLAQADAKVAELERDAIVRIDAVQAKSAAEVADAQAATKAATSRLETALQTISELQQLSAEQARSHSAAISAEHDRVARLQLELAAVRDELATAKDKLAATKDELIDAQQNHLTLNRELGRLDGQLSAHIELAAAQTANALRNNQTFSDQRDELMAQLAATRQQALQHSDALQSDLTRLRNEIALREQQLQQAVDLLLTTPQPLDGLSRSINAVVRSLIGRERVVAISKHATAIKTWQASFVPSSVRGPSQPDETAFPINNLCTSAQIMHHGIAETNCDEPVTTVAKLLLPNDREFIQTAYRAVLGRDPDPEGETYYLARLRSGTHKLAILKQLRRSPEGKTFMPGVAGLDKAIKRHIWATLPVLGMLVRLLRGDEGNSATHRSLRVITNEVGRLRSEYFSFRLEQAALTTVVRELVQTASSHEDNSISQPATELQENIGTTSEYESRASIATTALHNDRVSLPLSRGSRTVYVYVEHTASCATNTGVQRVTRGLATGLVASGERVRFVKWHAASQQCILINAEERQHLARWNGPEMGADEHELYRPVGEPGLAVEPAPVGENNWLIVPEVTHITPQPQPVTLDLLTWAKRAGLKSGVVFYDAIPLRRAELDPVVPVHTRYMQQLLLADVVWPISDWSKRDLQAFWIGHERADSTTMPETHTLHLPGDSTIFERVTVPTDGEPMILSVGSIEPRKNQVQLLKAFGAYRKKNPETPWRLVLVGNLHPLVAEEVAHATRPGSGVEHLGHVSDGELVDLYNRCAFTVFPSLEEGFGLPILESLWFGKPCICANFGAMAEVADGGGCLEVDTRDAVALEDGIRRLIEDERLRSALAQQAVDRPILSWEDYTGTITARIDREGQPGLRSGMVYFWIDATLEFAKNTGIQRVARQLARSMIALGMRLVPVKWSATEGIGPVSEEELQFFSLWNGPSVDAWHPWADPEQAGGGAWFFMPELPLNRTPVERSRIIEACRRYGLRKAAVFHDAIPWKMRDIYPSPYTEAHGAYMLELADYDLVLPNSLSSGGDLLDFQGANLARPLGLTDKIKAVPLAGEFPESERIIVGPAPHGGPLRVLSVGTVEPRKNHETLLRAFAIASQRPGFDLQLTIVGGPHSIDPDLPGRVRAVVADHPNITWEEDADDARLRALYHHCDFTVYPSIEEGFGLPIVESLWHARPCVCANFGAMAEVAEGGGCLAVDVRDPEALADALYRMASDQRLREDLVQQAITRPFKSWADYATQVATLMAEATPPPPPPPALLSPAEVAEYGRALRLQPRPKLSVCISTYNRAEWLSSSLRNWSRLYPHPLPSVELLVCDNASTDNTPEVVSPYLQRSDFSYHRNAQNVGMLGNLRETAHHARGEYVWIVGDDDLMLPGAIERVLRAIDEYRDIPLVYLNYAYTHEDDARNVTDFDVFFAGAIPIVPPEPDRYGPIREICARNENFFTAIYTLVFRRDHAIKAYSQDTSGRPFSSMPTCIPTTHYVLGHMMDAPGLWVGTPQIVVNMNVSWMRYAPLWILERIPEVYDRAEQAGVRAEDMDRWRAHTLPGVVHFFQDIYRDDPLGNGEFFTPDRLVRRFKHLPQFAEALPVLESTYARAHAEGHAAARRHPAKVFPKN